MEKREIRDIDNIKTLVDYLQKNLKKGYKIDGLRWALINQGYSRINIDRALKYVIELEKARELKKPITKVQKIDLNALNIQEEKSFWQKIKEWFS